VDRIEASAEHAAAAALVAYAHELLRRCRGQGSGPAGHVLWRRLAWDPRGSPNRSFTLRAEDILAAQTTLCAALKAPA
jgi:hypothetical protein